MGLCQLLRKSKHCEGFVQVCPLWITRLINGIHDEWLSYWKIWQTIFYVSFAVNFNSGKSLAVDPDDPRKCPAFYTRLHKTRRQHPRNGKLPWQAERISTILIQFTSKVLQNGSFQCPQMKGWVQGSMNWWFGNFEKISFFFHYFNHFVFSRWQRTKVKPYFLVIRRCFTLKSKNFKNKKWLWEKLIPNWEFKHETKLLAQEAVSRCKINTFWRLDWQNLFKSLHNDQQKNYCQSSMRICTMSVE